MLQYIIKRLLLLPLLLFIFSIIAFILIQAPPGDFMTSYIAELAASGSSMDRAQIDALRALYGLDQPLIVQYFKWIGRLLSGDLGISLDWRNPAVRQLRTLSGWALGYVVANQVAIVVVQNLLLRTGADNPTGYTNAFIFFMLPHGLLAMSIATTFLPEMAQAVNERRRDRMIDRTSLGIRLIALVTIPAGFGLFTLRHPLIGLLLQRGEYDAADAALAARALAGFALGLGAFSVYLFTLRAFYAHQDARTPCIVNIVENGINIVIALILYQRYGVLGIAASFAIAYVLSALWALQILTYKVRDFPMRPVLAALARVVLASVVMAEVVWFVVRAVGSNAGQGALVRLVAGTIVGIVVYVGVLIALRAPELDALLRRLRPTPSASTPPAH